MVRRKNKRVALERIKILFKCAIEIFHEDAILAQHYVDLARKMSMRYKVRMPTENKLVICKHCKSIIIPGIKCRVRLQQKREPHITITCLNCNKMTRIPIKRRSNLHNKQTYARINMSRRRRL